MCNIQVCIALAKIKHIILTPNILAYNITSLEKKLKNQDISLKYHLIKYMIENVLTKPLAKDRHQALTKAMGLEAFDCLQNGSVEGRALDCL